MFVGVHCDIVVNKRNSKNLIQTKNINFFVVVGLFLCFRVNFLCWYDCVCVYCGTNKRNLKNGLHTKYNFFCCRSVHLKKNIAANPRCWCSPVVRIFGQSLNDLGSIPGTSKF